jgi:hypothetical protein
MSEMKQEDRYKFVTGLLQHIISSESKYVASQRNVLKDDEFIILRLQNKARILDIEIEKREKLIDKYRGYLEDISELAYISMSLMPSKRRTIDTKSSSIKFKLIKNLGIQEV